MARVKIFYVDHKNRPRANIYETSERWTPDTIVFGFINECRDHRFLCAEISYNGYEWYRLYLTSNAPFYA